MQRQLLPGITTTPGSDWHSMLEVELPALGLTEVSVFMTGLKSREKRSSFYDQFLQIGKKQKITVPFVHAVAEMESSEYLFWMYHFKTEYFVLHSELQYKRNSESTNFLEGQILIENSIPWIDDEEAERHAGYCFDFAHGATDRLTRPHVYAQSVKHALTAASKGTLCNHISGFSGANYFIHKPTGLIRYDLHHLRSLRDLDYLQGFGSELFGKFLALEVEDSLTRQLEAIEYIKYLLPHIFP
ncbi:MAG: hypothetical protein NTW50_02090 [Candidatus Berkelbacteria bacterium]|nr:hypothetical protein [Candidatus Berkelbacteria bacterium]